MRAGFVLRRFQHRARRNCHERIGLSKAAGLRAAVGLIANSMSYEKIID
jgi:hypothetical protein